MNRLALVAFACLATSSAFASPKLPPAPECKHGFVDVFSCGPAHGPEGVAVNVKQCGKDEKATFAWIYEPAQGGKPTLSAITKVALQAPIKHLMGGPKIFTGNSFKLSIGMTTAPLPGNRHASFLDAKTNRGSLKQVEVGCAAPK